MIQSLNHIQRSTPLSQDFEEFVDCVSRSSSSNGLSPDEISSKHDNEHESKLQHEILHHGDKSQEHVVFYQFPRKPTKPKNLNLNVHRQHVQNQLKSILFEANIKSQHGHIRSVFEREESRESNSSLNSSVETPHERTDDEKYQTHQHLFAKQSPIAKNVHLTTTNSNISTSTSLDILIFDACTSHHTKAAKVSICIKPNDSTNDVILAVIEQYHLNHNVADYELLYYDDSEHEIADYFPPLARDEIIATKNIDILAMKFIDNNHYKYEVQTELRSDCILVIEKDQMYIRGQYISHFSYVFDLESSWNHIHNLDPNRWIDRRVLKEVKQNEECEATDICMIESIQNVSIAETNNTAFEIHFLLDTESKTSARSSRSSTIEFIDAGSYKPANYSELWNPTQIIPKLQEIAAAQYVDDDDESSVSLHTFRKEKYSKQTLKYFARSEQECSQIVTKINHLLLLENN